MEMLVNKENQSENTRIVSLFSSRVCLVPWKPFHYLFGLVDNVKLKQNNAQHLGLIIPVCCTRGCGV